MVSRKRARASVGLPVSPCAVRGCPDAAPGIRSI